MKQTKNYAPPIVLKESRLYLETEVLAGSIADQAGEIKAVGQEVETHNFGTGDWNHSWEDAN